MSIAHQSSQNQRTLIIWTIMAVVALVAIFLGVNSASKQKTSTLKSSTTELEQVTGEDHVKGGNFSSPVTIVEYSDFQCPACAVYYPLVKKIIEKNNTNVQFVYRYFPLQAIHKNAFPAAIAAEAAGKQGKFWEMHDLLFERQKEWSGKKNTRDIFIKYAKELGLDIEIFSINIDNNDLKTRVDRDYQSGTLANVEGTPTFFVNGKKIKNPSSYEEFQKLIDDVVAKKS